jgi:hypothetical protein
LIALGTLSPILSKLSQDIFRELNVVQNDKWLEEESSSEEKNEIEESKKNFDSDFTFTVPELKTDRNMSSAHFCFEHAIETHYQEVNVPPPDFNL